MQRILKDQYNNKRKPAEELALKKLAAILKIKNYQEVNIQYVLKNWSILLLNNEKELRSNGGLKKILKKYFRQRQVVQKKNISTLCNVQ